MGRKAVETESDRKHGAHAKQRHTPNAEDRSLATLGNATRMLAEVRSAHDAKELMDRAEAMKIYAQKAKLGDEAVAHAEAIRLDAKRMLGGYLADMPKATGQLLRGSELEPRGEQPPTLADLGIDKKLSMSSQKLAALPDDQYERIKSGDATERQVVTAVNRNERTENLATIAKGNAAIGTAERYPVIYGDPPWRYEHVKTENRAIENHYPTMDLEEIKSLPIGDLATEDALLFLWATSPKLAEALAVVDAWGFTYRTCMVWVKDRIGMGYYARQRHEILLIATRGNPPTPPENARPDSVIESPLGKHSAKPSAFAETIERMYPTLPKIELFCRSAREGWAVWGNQS